MKTSNLINGFLILSVLFLAISCESNREADRALQIFFLGVLQVLNMILFGICSVLFCVLAGTNGKQVFKVLGWIFFSLFTLFALIGFNSVQRIGPRDPEIYIVFLMEAAMIVVSFVFIVRNKKPVTSEKRQSELDQVIHDNEVL